MKLDFSSRFVVCSYIHCLEVGPRSVGKESLSGVTGLIYHVMTEENIHKLRHESILTFS